MPHFTLTVGPLGPIVSAVIGVSKDRSEALRQAGQQVPVAVPVTALVDTGASCTALDPKVLRQLGVTPTGRAKVHTPSTQKTPFETNQYDVGIMIPGSTPEDIPFFIPVLPVIESELENLGYTALIGRDILNECLLVYEGKGKFFTLAF